ncbi:3-hydroxyacyl-[acyl-carrier-protein] dehydratase [Arcicella aurantiaca]|uniref:3-hydroxyacyl-[acyl-carrier-protein] dehydratase n=1 Tax=Arcicella aurantiaca TaxID=591202 RepID=A0A316E401_9BACT|nr:3-hydroxyacyl-[acyl-carrier-protein] dehydratase FabZ [Arcicella aurantiaca]PWK17620.1 3-hydroxyacyl-[acyl-carrier-protein] dehydratase [Arcicella aurantiaca]
MNPLLNNYQIQQLLPHRYPIQLVDQVIEFEENKEIIALKAIGIGEPALRGHFPNFPIMPGVLLVEALGQTCALLLELTRRQWKVGDDFNVSDEQSLGVLGGVKVKMLKPVLPGTLVKLKATLDWSKGPASSLNVVAYDAINEKKIFVRGSILVAMAPKSSLSS